jgi:hypothetical protein
MGKGAVLAAALAMSAAVDVLAAPVVWTPPQPVRIEGYDGEAMEPFLSRDGGFLFFNTRNDPGVDTDIHVARQLDDLTFVHLGVVAGTKSSDLDGVPTMARDGSFCFISPRDYRQTLNSVFCGRFNGRDVGNVKPQTGLKTERLGRLIFDAARLCRGNVQRWRGTGLSGATSGDAKNERLCA